MKDKMKAAGGHNGENGKAHQVAFASPNKVREVAATLSVAVNGLYAETPEAVLAPFEESPDGPAALLEQLKELAATG